MVRIIADMDTTPTIGKSPQAGSSPRQELVRLSMASGRMWRKGAMRQIEPIAMILYLSVVAEFTGTEQLKSFSSSAAAETRRGRTSK
ncbi:hypothetical protein HID58_028587 [Brassica napus]|uniref:Uncharacterized protein n=1 Tax=Brassica napus TaxID=3708 RepID=A0ABQ8CAP1_BRANA|nr:hypothetical protein HID58_028587 [Brassica napus]